MGCRDGTKGRGACNYASWYAPLVQRLPGALDPLVLVGLWTNAHGTSRAIRPQRGPHRSALGWQRTKTATYLHDDSPN